MASTGVCQIAFCANPKFAYCPHCSLHVCMQCLNEHYLLMETNYKQELLNFREELNTNRYYYMNEQQKLANELYNHISNQFHQFENFLLNKLDHDGLPLVNNFHPHQCIELQQQIDLSVKIRRNYDQLLKDINQLIYDFQHNGIKSRHSIDMPIALDDIHSNPKSSVIITLESDDEVKDNEDNESGVESSSTSTLKTFIENRLLDVSSKNNKISRLASSSTEQKSPRTYSAKELRAMCFTCPLEKHTFGLQKHHCQPNSIAHIPCRRQPNPETTLFSHLNRYHLFNTQSALKIIGTLVYYPNQLDQIDLFSNEQPTALGGNILLAFTARCPLTKYKVYGVLPEHEVKICDKYQTSEKLLHYHLRRYHKIAHPFATRIVRAVMNNIDETTELIKPDEIILSQK